MFLDKGIVQRYKRHIVLGLLSAWWFVVSVGKVEAVSASCQSGSSGLNENWRSNHLRLRV